MADEERADQVVAAPATSRLGIHGRAAGALEQQQPSSNVISIAMNGVVMEKTAVKGMHVTGRRSQLPTCPRSG
jgi:hypothetical protein